VFGQRTDPLKISYSKWASVVDRKDPHVLRSAHRKGIRPKIPNCCWQGGRRRIQRAAHQDQRARLPQCHYFAGVLTPRRGPCSLLGPSGLGELERQRGIPSGIRPS
jgi:hypothetical protein